MSGNAPPARADDATVAHVDVPMFVVLVRYVQPQEAMLRHLNAHRAFLDRWYARGVFVVSGRGAGDDPGVIVATGVDRDSLRTLLCEDAFHRHGVAEYDIVGFHASRVCAALGPHVSATRAPSEEG